MRPVPLFLLLPLAACATGGATDRDLAHPVPAATYPAGRDTILQRVPRRNEKVRVRFPATALQPERYIVGSLLRLAGDTVIIARAPHADTVVLTDGRQLQAVRRSHGHMWGGAGIGLLAGGALGAAIGAATWQPCTGSGYMSCFLHPDRGGQTVIGGVLGGLLGAVAGAAIGGGTRTETWGTVPIAGARVTVRPSAIGVAIRY